MRPTMVSCWQSLKRSRLEDTTWRAVSMKFSYSQTTTTFSASWIQKTWALNKSGRFKSCQGTNSGLVIHRAKLMELLMPCLNTPSGMLRKKRPSEPRIQKSCTDCSPRWLECMDWASWEWAFRKWNSRCCSPCTKSSSVGQLSYYSYASFGTLFEVS